MSKKNKYPNSVVSNDPSIDGQINQSETPTRAVKFAEGKTIELGIRTVFFIDDAIVNFNRQSSISDDTHEIIDAGQYLLFIDKKSNATFAIPQANIRTILFK